MASKEALDQAAANRAAVRALMMTFPGITQREIAAVLGLSAMCVNRHFNAVRKAWRPSFAAGRGHLVRGLACGS